ncbi:MAG: dicarboxylate/amino acid:cation symporter, partial [Clostridiaceae bacterium]|nr:dicarboxylate/amino acid:cation symporter [Clostridiaceae bacterium]
MKKLKADFLLTPWATIIGMVTGIIIGIYGQQIIPYIKPVGEIYLSILQMSVIPIMASAIVMSIGKLLMSEEASRYLAKLIRVFVIFLLGVSLVSILISIIVSPLIASDNETKKAIGKMMLSSSTTSSTDTTSSITVIKEIDSRYNN